MLYLSPKVLALAVYGLIFRYLYPVLTTLTIILILKNAYKFSTSAVSVAFLRRGISIPSRIAE